MKKQSLFTNNGTEINYCTTVWINRDEKQSSYARLHSHKGLLIYSKDTGRIVMYYTWNRPSMTISRVRHVINRAADNTLAWSTVILPRERYYRPKMFCPALVTQEGSALWGNTLTTALLHDLNRTIPFGTILQFIFFLLLRSNIIF